MLRKDNVNAMFYIKQRPCRLDKFEFKLTVTLNLPVLLHKHSSSEKVIAFPLKWRDILRESYRIRFLSTRHRWSGSCECLPHCTMRTCFQMWPSSVNCANAINKASHLSPKCNKMKHARRWNKATNSRPPRMSSWWLYLVNSFGRQEARKLI